MTIIERARLFTKGSTPVRKRIAGAICDLNTPTSRAAGRAPGDNVPAT